VKTLVLSISIMVGGCALASFAQVAGTTAAAPLKLAQSNYLRPGAVPPNAIFYLHAIGNHLQTPGKERMTLTGTATDQRGTGAAVLVWQLPGSVSLTRLTSATPLIFTPGGGVSNGAALGQSDQDVLEDLSSGTQEAFLYSFVQNTGHRLLATHVRNDDGKTANYSGPYWDIYETLGPAAAAGNAVRQKWFYFDETTGLLAKVRYLVRRGGADLAVENQYSGWAAQAGQQYPGQIVRTENGTAVFTFRTTQAAFGQALNDSVFAGH
jgi:hypothetical protein